MASIKYCVAHVYVNCIGEATVSYYAYQKGSYGLHLVGNKNDENVLWYDTAEEARKHVMCNEGECVMSFHTDYIPKFRKVG